MIPTLSIVTGALNRPAAFHRLLASIVAHTSPVTWELVVSDASDIPLEIDNHAVRILPERPRLGCARGYNRAFAAARGEWVIWLNDDAEVLPGYAEAAIQFMTEHHPNIGLGALHYSENGSQFHVNSAWGTIYANFGIIKRTLGCRVGWFDEDIQMYGCDNSLALRVLLAGYGIADIPGSRVVHHSEKDHHRRENQQSRAMDNAVLTRKYMPRRKAWQATYARFATEGSSPWVHGRAPLQRVAR